MSAKPWGRDPHEFHENVNDASMCLCGIPALTHDAVMSRESKGTHMPSCNAGCIGDSHRLLTEWEAAEILATYISVRVVQRGVDDTELSHTFIAECISEARYEKTEGTYLNVAGWVRPSDRTIWTAYRRASGVI